MTEKQATTLTEFSRTVGTNSIGMIAASTAGSNKPEYTKQTMNRMYDLHHQPMRDHYVNQLKKKYGGDIRARLKAKIDIQNFQLKTYL